MRRSRRTGRFDERLRANERQPFQCAVGSHEGLDKCVGGLRENGLGRRVLNECAVAQDGDAIAHLDCLVDVVGDEHHRLLERAQDAQEFILKPRTRNWVDGAKRFIHQHYRRVRGERARDADALLLSARQFAREAGPKRCRIHTN